MNEELLRTRLDAAVKAADYVGVDPQADVERGQRALRRRRRLLIGVSVAATVVVLTAGVGLGQLGGSGSDGRGAEDRGAPIAGGPEASQQTRSRHDRPKPSVRPTETPITKAQSRYDPTGGVGYHDWRYQLYDAAKTHLDPKHEYLNYDTDSLQSSGGSGGAQVLGIKLGWSAPGDSGEGMIQIAVASSDGRRLVYPCAYFGPCHDERVPGHGTVTMSGDPSSGAGYAVIVTQADGEYVQVVVDPLFGNNSLTPTEAGLVDLDKVLSLTEDPALDLP